MLKPIVFIPEEFADSGSDGCVCAGCNGQGAGGVCACGSKNGGGGDPIKELIVE